VPWLVAGLIAVFSAAVAVAVHLAGRPPAAAATPFPARRLLGAAPATTGARPWVTTWGTSPQAASWLPRGLAPATVRDVVSPTAGGEAVRVRLTNAYSRRPLRIDAAAIGRAAGGAAVSHAVPLTFAGRRAVTLPPGADRMSDPAALAVPAHRRLAISVSVAAPVMSVTGHRNAQERSFIAPPGHAGDLGGRAFTRVTTAWYFLDGVDVLPRPGTWAVVALGDSITDGVASGLGTEARWPDALSRRLGPGVALVNAGIGGNRVLHPSPCCGASAPARFRADVVQRSGVRTVVLLEGINDIGLSRTSGPLSAPHTAVSAAQIIAGYQRLIAAAHAAGLRMLGGTLLPFRGAGYWSAAGEAEREAINRWIRTSGAFDGVIDFARALADPHRPTALRPAYDSGDHLHPDAAGYRAMAAAVDPVSLLP
jgi:lysophospholipase L1-like esterase